MSKWPYFLLVSLMLMACEALPNAQKTTQRELAALPTNETNSDLASTELSELDIEARVSGSWRETRLESINSLVHYFHQILQHNNKVYLLRSASIQASTQYSLQVFDGEQAQMQIERLPGGGDRVQLLSDGQDLYYAVSAVIANSPRSIARLTDYEFTLYKVQGSELERVYSQQYFESRDKAAREYDRRYQDGSWAFYQGKLTLAYQDRGQLLIEQLQGDTWLPLTQTSVNEKFGQMHVGQGDKLTFFAGSTQSPIAALSFDGQWTQIPNTGLPEDLNAIMVNSTVVHAGDLYWAGWKGLAVELGGFESGVKQAQQPFLYRYNTAQSQWEQVYTFKPVAQISLGEPARYLAEEWSNLRSDQGHLFVQTFRRDVKSRGNNQTPKGIKVFELPQVKDYITNEFSKPPSVLPLESRTEIYKLFYFNGFHIGHQHLYSFEHSAQE